MLHTIKKAIIQKLNPLDWIVITISFAVVLYLIASSSNQEKWITVEFKVIYPNSYFANMNGEAPFWLANQIKKGDVQYDNLGKKNLELVDVTQWGFQSKEIWVTALVKAKYKPKQKKYTFLYQPLEIGRGIDVTVNGSSIHGIITAIQGFSDTRQTYDIRVKMRLLDTTSPYSVYTRGIDPWIADSIKNNMDITDQKGEVIARITDVMNKPAERIYTTSDGRTGISEDPLKKDVTFTMQLKVKKQGTAYLFLEDKPLIIGWSLPVFINNLALYPIVTEILE